VVVHGGTAEGQYYSENVEVWISTNGTTYTEVASGALANSSNDSITLPLGDVAAKKIKLIVTSGYSTAFWELAEFEVYGTVIE
jgi:hypothetical protein